MLTEQCDTHIHIELGGKSTVKNERVRIINVLTHSIIKLCVFFLSHRVSEFTSSAIILQFSSLYSNDRFCTFYILPLQSGTIFDDHNGCWYLLKFCQKTIIRKDQYRKKQAPYIQIEMLRL